MAVTLVVVTLAAVTLVAVTLVVVGKVSKSSIRSKLYCARINRHHLFMPGIIGTYCFCPVCLSSILTFDITFYQ